MTRRINIKQHDIVWLYNNASLIIMQTGCSSGLDSNNYFVPSAVNNMLHHIPTMTKPQNCENITCLAGPY